MTRTEYKQIQWNKYHRVNINNIVERRCTSCGDWLEENLDNFYLLNKSYPERGYTGMCRKCTSQKTLAYHFNHRDERLIYLREAYAKDPDKYIEWDRQNRLADLEYHKLKDRKWREANPEKCREYSKRHRNHDITEAEWRGCLKVFNYECAYCGLSQDDHWVERKGKYIIMKLHRDHADDNGANDLRNAIPACQSCNTSKHEDSIDEWYKTRDFYDEERYNKIIWWTTEGYKDHIEEKPPYRIVKRKNSEDNKFHHELWTVDEFRNMIDLIDVGDKKKDLDLSLINELKE